MKKILYFSAAWCGPCKVLGPVMDKLKMDGMPVQKIDVDSNQEMSTKYGVRNIPCLVLVDNMGNELKRLVGNKPSNEIQNWYNN
jgi:thioredoxin 1|tara:strand:+ start:316 stop:567 length:252 start_codon:yes stop_codon:yes gene_type:complete